MFLFLPLYSSAVAPRRSNQTPGVESATCQPTSQPTHRARVATTMSSSSSSASMGALAAATAMALSGSLVLFSLRRFAKPDAASDEPASLLRPCLSSSEKRPRGGMPRRKGEKRVRFAEGVVDNEGAAPPARSLPPVPAPEPTCRGNATVTTTTEAADHRMPANREALYRGMLRDRSVHRTAYSY